MKHKITHEHDLQNSVNCKAVKIIIQWIVKAVKNIYITCLYCTRNSRLIKLKLLNYFTEWRIFVVVEKKLNQIDKIIEYDRTCTAGLVNYILFKRIFVKTGLQQFKKN